MSAVATFKRIRKSDLGELRRVASPSKNWRGKTTDDYPAFLVDHATDVATYPWSGYVLATLLTFLQEQGVDLMASEYDELATHICNARQTTCFILTAAHKSAYFERLTADAFTSDQLRDYYNEFNECSEPDAGRPMVDGIAAFRQSLESLDAETVGVFAVG